MANALRWMVKLIGGPNWQVLEQAQAQPSKPIALPAEIEIEGTAFAIRELAPGDEPALLAFARALPPHDLLFLRRDITRADQVDALVHASQAGISNTLLVIHEGEVVGYTTIASDGITWTRHIRELRVLVSEKMRGKHLGTLLTSQAFALAREQGAKKMVAQMTVDQEAAVAAFKRLGFEQEARLKNHVIDREGQLHDLFIMTLDIESFEARLELALVPTTTQMG